MTRVRTFTEEDLLAMPRDRFKRELVDGEIRVSPAGAPHGMVITRLGARLELHVESARLGWVFDSSTGLRMPSRNLRVPDLIFVSRRRMPGGVVAGFLTVMPDLAVEVLSPGDVERHVLDKVGECLSAGVALVWVLDPEARHAAVHRSLTSVTALAPDDSLDGEDVVPGFRCSLAELFDGR